jgi:hypothetical protein
MIDMDEARQWHELVRHLVQSHGAKPDRMTGFVHTLGEVRFTHLDTHAALTIISQRPPDDHAHPAPADPGLLSPLSSAYMPFPGSPSAREKGGYRYASRHPPPRGSFHPFPEFTGLPQTGVHPRTEADLADWPSAAMRILLEIYREYDGLGAAEAAPRIREVIERNAVDAVEGYWEASTKEPAAPVWITPEDRPSRRTTSQARRASDGWDAPRMAAESFPENAGADRPRLCRDNETARRVPGPSPDFPNAPLSAGPGIMPARAARQPSWQVSPRAKGL